MRREAFLRALYIPGTCLVLPQIAGLGRDRTATARLLQFVIQEASRNLVRWCSACRRLRWNMIPNFASLPLLPVCGSSFEACSTETQLLRLLLRLEKCNLNKAHRARKGRWGASPGTNSPDRDYEAFTFDIRIDLDDASFDLQTPAWVVLSEPSSPRKNSLKRSLDVCASELLILFSNMAECTTLFLRYIPWISGGLFLFSSELSTMFSNLMEYVVAFFYFCYTPWTTEWLRICDRIHAGELKRMEHVLVQIICRRRNRARP